MIEINEKKEVLENLLIKKEIIETDYSFMENMKKVHEDYLEKSAGSTINSKNCWLYQN